MPHGLSKCGVQVSGATARAAAEGLSGKFTAFGALAPFVASLARPRRIILLVPAGKPVDGALASLGDVLAAGDVIMDGGNEWFENTVGWGSARAKKHIIIWSFFYLLYICRVHPLGTHA